MRKAGLGCLLSALLVGMTPGQATGVDSPLTYLERDPSDGKYEVIYEDAGGPSTVGYRDSLTSPAISPDGSKIAFSGVVGDGSLGLYAIFLINVDGTGVEQLTDGSFAELDPSWSPDGSEIVFSLNDTGSYDISTCCRVAKVDVSTGVVSTVTGNNGAVRPAFSPNGATIAFENPTGIYTVSANGGSSTLRGANGQDPTYSPDGSRIAYVVRSGSTFSLRTVPAAGGSALTLYSTARSIEAPDWEGDRIYFVEHDGFGYDSRSDVEIKSIASSGGSPILERQFSGTVAELDVYLGEILPAFGFAAGDFDGDGRDDIVTRGFCGDPPEECWRVQISNGAGFGTVQDWGDGGYFSSETVAFGIFSGDFDGDGMDDLAYRGFCGSQEKCWRVHISTGSGFSGGQK